MTGPTTSGRSGRTDWSSDDIIVVSSFCSTAPSGAFDADRHRIRLVLDDAGQRRALERHMCRVSARSSGAITIGSPPAGILEGGHRDLAVVHRPQRIEGDDIGRLAPDGS